MNLLQLAHRLPWPPIDGGNKGVLGFVEGYSRHPSVTRHSLVCLCRLEDAHWAYDWKPKDVHLTVEPMDARNSIPRLLANTLFSRRPFNMEKYRRPSFARKIDSAIAEVTPDVVHFDGLHMAAYAPQIARLAPRALRVLRCHNAEYMILERLAESEPSRAKRALIALQAKRVKVYEAAMLDHFDLILAITETDAARFKAINRHCADRIIIVPAGANLPATLPPESRQEGERVRLIHVAAMDWLPNQGGLRWLRDDVLPLLNAAGLDYHLDVIGKNMPTEFTAMNGPRVTVHGFVENLTPLMSAAHVAVVPLKVGSGMRVKILDYWSAGIPVVATRVAAEGLDGGDPPVVALADDPVSFSNTVQRLAADPAERRAVETCGVRQGLDRLWLAGAGRPARATVPAYGRPNRQGFGHRSTRRVTLPLDPVPPSWAGVAPAVLVVIPTFNEALHIEMVLRQLSSGNPIANPMRFVVCDGGSEDGTQEIVARLAGADERIVLLHNPKRLQAAAVNQSVRSLGAGFDVLVRCDAHSIYPARFISDLMGTLEHTNADAVVVPMDSKGDTCLSRAVAWVSDTLVGSGGAAHRGGSRSGFVDHGHHAAFRMAAFISAGGYDESFSHNEDAELDCRQRALGARIFLDCDIRIGYVSRGTLGGLWRQYFAYGRGRSRTVRRHPTSLRLRQFAVPAHLVMLVLCGLGVSWYPWLAAWPGLYLGVLGLTASVLAIRHGSLCGLLAAPAAVVMHIGYALGFIWGMMAHREVRWRRGSVRPLILVGMPEVRS